MNTNPVHIAFEHVGKSLGRGEGRRRILDDIALEVRQGEFLTFFGPNGCGKTTLLNMLAGLESVDEGVLKINPTNPRNEKPRVGYIFQDYRGNLMPWLTVAENIAFPLKIRGVSRAERAKKVEALCDRFGFAVDLKARTILELGLRGRSDFLAHELPDNLRGGRMPGLGFGPEPRGGKLVHGNTENEANKTRTAGE